jgi:hypothetical protein
VLDDDEDSELGSIMLEGGLVLGEPRRELGSFSLWTGSDGISIEDMPFEKLCIDKLCATRIIISFELTHLG